MSTAWKRRVSACVVVGAVLIGALTGGINIPGLGIQRLLPGSGGLDYARAPYGVFAPLRDAYIQDVLGDVIPLGVNATARGSASRLPPQVPGPPEWVVDDHPPTNATPQSAREVSSIPFTARTDTTNISREGDHPSQCSQVGPAVYYRFRPRRHIGVVANTFGTRHATVLGVFNQSEGGETICDQPDARGDSMIAFRALGGASYLIQVSSPRGGKLVFNLESQGVTQPLALEFAPGLNQMPLAGGHWAPAISHDGNIVAYLSTNYSDEQEPPCKDPPGVTVGALWWSVFLGNRPAPCAQIVVYDLKKQKRSVASLSPDREPANAHVLEFSLSGDGRTIAFSTFADNLVGDGRDTNALSDVFVHDLQSHETERISVSPEGAQMNRPAEDVLGAADARHPSISRDGRYVVFESAASNLIEGDRDGVVDGDVDVFIRDRKRGETRRVSLNSAGKPASEADVSVDNRERLVNRRSQSAFPCISSNGRFIAFTSAATNFTSRDQNDRTDVFVHDVRTHVTELVSVARQGGTGNDASGTGMADAYPRPCVSDDGRFVVFQSQATDLTADDDGDWPAVDLFLRDRALDVTIGLSNHRYKGSSESDALDGSGADDVGTSDPSAWTNSFSITPDGRLVTFNTPDPLDDSDDDAVIDVYLYDTRHRAALPLAVTAPCNGGVDTTAGAMSADGRFIAFVGWDTGTRAGIFLHDREDAQ